jgi:hypothetical protein
MRTRLAFSPLPFLILFLALAPTAMASTTWFVNGANGSDSNNCKSSSTACKTIGHAISLAASGDSIIVASGTYKENLRITISVAIRGSRAAATIIDGGGRNTVVTIANAGTKVTLSSLTIRDGIAGGNGGGVANNGMLTISNSTLSGNTTFDQCVDELCLAQGGGIYNNKKGVLIIDNSTISGNTVACAGTSCHAAIGGGIYNNQGKVTINNSTISGNTALNSGGIYSTGAVTLQNSIVANNSGGNCGGTLTSNGYNLSSDSSCNFSSSGDQNNSDPKLGPLQNNGGPTQTMALLPGSPAIDAGNPNGCTDNQGHLLRSDQRGKTRPNAEDSGGCDMGAYERQSD